MRLPSCLSLCAVLALVAGAADLSAAEVPTVRGRQLLAERPLEFVPNQGQWPAVVQARAQAPDASVWFEPRGWLIDLERVTAVDEQGAPSAGRHVALRLRFDGATPRAPQGEQRLPGWRSDLSGRDAGRHAPALPAYARQRYAELYEGVDVLVRGDEGLVRYDLMLEPGADLGAVQLVVEGAEGLALERDGSLRIDTELGPLVQPAPITWTVLPDGSHQPVECAYVLLGEDRFGFVAPGFDGATPLVVDPTLEWGTFLGGSFMDFAYASVTDEAGGVTVVGYTISSLYPTTLGAYDVDYNGARDAFVTRLSSDGETLVFSTLLGGSGLDEARAVTLAPDGDVVVAGLTGSLDFPVAGAGYGTSFAGGGALTNSDAFVVRLDGTGTVLELGAYLGGSEDEWANDVEVDDEGTVYLAGLTRSTDFPATPGALSETFGGGTGAGDGWVARLTDDGATLAYATYLGGQNDDSVNALLPLSAGQVLATGWAASPDFPMPTGGAQDVFAGLADAFVVRLSGDGSRLTHGTWIGGSSDDQGQSLALDEAGRVLVAGATRSLDLPVSAGAPQPDQHGGWMLGDAFVARLDGNLRGLDLLTYLGGAADDGATAVTALPNGLVAVTGSTSSADLATTADAYDDSLGGALDAFLAVIDADAASLETLSYLGGSDNDKALSLVIHPDGRALLTGYSTSFDFPVTAGAFDEVFDGAPGFNSDSFVVAFDLGLNDPVSSTWGDLGYGLPGAFGEARLSATGSLSAGDSGSLVLSGFKPLAFGRFLFGVDTGYHPVKGGVCVPYPVTSEIFFQTSDLGELVLPYANPGALPEGLSFSVQAWVEDDTGPFLWTASNALEGLVP